MPQREWQLDLATLPILIVDDNKYACRLLSTILRAAGAVELRTCARPQDALDIMMTWNAGLILTDFLMKPMDGLQFSRTLRTDREYGFLAKPIVMMTAETPTQSFIKEVKGAGVDVLVTKPISPADLLKRMDWALVQARKRTEDAFKLAKEAQKAKIAEANGAKTVPPHTASKSPASPSRDANGDWVLD